MGCLPFLLISSLFSLHEIDVIEIQGNKKWDESSIIELLGYHPPCSVTDSSLHQGLKNILAHYRDHGFYDAQVTYRMEGKRISFLISEGTAYRIGNIKLSGNRFVKDAFASKLLGLRKGAPFSKILFEKGIRELLSFYGNRGFPFTSIVPISFTPEDEMLHIQLEVQEGPRLRWGKIHVQGNTVTKTYVIQKQMRIPTGDYFSESTFQTSQSWLSKLTFIETLDNATLLKGEQSATVDVLVTVREAKSNHANGILGYIPPKDNLKGGTVGIINAELLNLFGTARILRVAWEKQIPPYTKLNVSYTEPWIAGTRAEMALSFTHLLEDTLYTISRLAAEIKTAISLNLSLAAVAGWEKFAPATIALPPSNKYSIGTRFEIDYLDYAINPLKGIHYSFYTEYGKKGSVNIMKFNLKTLNVLPVQSNQAIALYFFALASRTNSPPLPEYELFSLGGYKSLRGYRERQFRATQLLRVSPEYRILVSRKSRLYAFYDAAFFESTTFPDNNISDHFRYGYGIGATFPVGIGILSIEYALGEEQTFLKGKIHLGLDTTF